MRLTTARQHGAPASWPPSGWVPVVAGVTLLGVFALDRATGAAPVQHLYYVPIIIAGVRMKMRGGVLAAVVAIILYHVANPHLLTFQYEEQDVVQVALLLTVGIVTARLALDADRLHHLAMTDDLTGLHNLRSFESGLAAMTGAMRNGRGSLAMLVLDVDRLKALNDVHGHLTGAEAVRTVGAILARVLPDGAMACRYGGDEFAVALPWCGPAQALRIGEDVRRAVEDVAPVLAGRRFPAGTLSVSVGGAATSFDAADTGGGTDVDIGEALFRAADTALYGAKSGGRNRVWVSGASQPGLS